MKVAKKINISLLTFLKIGHIASIKIFIEPIYSNTMKKLNWLSLGLCTFLMISCTEKEINNNTNSSTTVTTSTTTLKNETAPSLEELKNDANVLWVGEKMVDYAPNYNKWTAQAEDKKIMDSAGFASRNDFKILKYQVTDLNKSDNEDHYLVYKLIQNIEKLNCYKDAELSQKYSLEESKNLINSIDTIITFDPKDYKEIIQVIVNELDPRDARFFRVKEMIYYDKKAMIFRSIPMAIAPMICQFDNQGNYKGSEALFWIKPNFLTTTPSLDAQNITWAKRLYRNCPLADVTVKKSDKSLAETMDVLMADLRQNADNIYLGHVFDADGNQAISAEEVKVLGASIDTIITFDPKDFKEKIQVVHNNVKGKDIQGIRLMQDWIWDNEAKQLNICYVGFKPLINRYDDKGNFLNSGPMFTRKVTDIKKGNL